MSYDLTKPIHVSDYKALAERIKADFTTKEEFYTFTHFDRWSDVTNAVRRGLGPKLFSVGYEFETTDSDMGVNIVWAVRGHDHHAAANEQLAHTMTLEMKNVYSKSSGAVQNMQFDAAGALYYAEDGLAAGLYNFTVADQTWYTGDNGKTFQFNLANAIPAGGQIVLNASYNQTLEGKTASTFAGPSSVDAIETVSITEGNAGRSLGTTGTAGSGLNHITRALLGSNNIAQSALRQWMNSANEAGSVWSPTNKFDRPPSWADTNNGFMHGLPADFLAAVQPAVIPCRTNSVYEVNSLDGTVFTTNQLYNLEDKFFFLSRPEITGVQDSTSYRDGTILEYYKGLTATELIKRDESGSAREYFLRSPNSYNTDRLRSISNSGEGTNRGCSLGAAFAVACIIA